MPVSLKLPVSICLPVLILLPQFAASVCARQPQCLMMTPGMNTGTRRRDSTYFAPFGATH
jgi:hypothetical protein